MNSDIVGKRLGLLHELSPGAQRFAALVDPSTPNHQLFVTDAQAAELSRSMLK
jgi:hypothetical protein